MAAVAPTDLASVEPRLADGNSPGLMFADWVTDQVNGRVNDYVNDGVSGHFKRTRPAPVQRMAQPHDRDTTGAEGAASPPPRARLDIRAGTA